MSRLAFNETPIAGLRVITRDPAGDERGFFERLFCQQTLDNRLGGKTIRQINHTLTRREGTVRGLHFQYPPHSEIKIVSCIKGIVWDVAVDIRRGSPTFLQHYSVVLSQDNFQSLLIPEGFAHGFQALTPDCEMLYFHTADYMANAEGALNAVDPQLAINWPKPIAARSERDTTHSLLNRDFSGIEVA
jgi:dTDP-4-dehydrorhamnose 3,5-epimerase